MALDQQRNWDLAMAENLQKVILDAEEKEKKRFAPKMEHLIKKIEEIKPWTSPPIYLPDEIIIHILSYVAAQEDSRQRTLGSCCLLSRQWFAAAVPELYARPYLYGPNFDPFVRAICPSINIHVRESPLSTLVRELNMGKLVHQSGKSLTARILGRTKGGLELFVAPQASFAVNCLPALSKCKNLQVLDLSLVSESPALPQLLKTVSHLPKLRVFRLPRSSGFGTQNPAPIVLPWPPALEDVALSGGIDGHFIHGFAAFPKSLRRLTIEHCPAAKGSSVNYLLRSAIRPLLKLESLTIRYMPQLSPHALDDVLGLLPQLRRLSISVDYITPAVFDVARTFAVFGDLLTSEDVSSISPEGICQHNLRTLELTSSGNIGAEDKISPIDILIAVDDQTLPRLRQVRVTRSLLWKGGATEQDAEALADALQEASKRDWELRDGIFAKMPEKRYNSKDIWEEVAGVWQFD